MRNEKGYRNLAIRILHEEDLCGLYWPPSFIRAVILWWSWWGRHVARLVREKCLQIFGRESSYSETGIGD
jgi:hypothetical protein